MESTSVTTYCNGVLFKTWNAISRDIAIAICNRDIYDTLEIYCINDLEDGLLKKFEFPKNTEIILGKLHFTMSICTDILYDKLPEYSLELYINCNLHHRYNGYNVRTLISRYNRDYPHLDINSRNIDKVYTIGDDNYRVVSIGF